MSMITRMLPYVAGFVIAVLFAVATYAAPANTHFEPTGQHGTERAVGHQNPIARRTFLARTDPGAVSHAIAHRPQLPTHALGPTAKSPADAGLFI